MDFVKPIRPKDEVRPTGYEEEKWHWSYLPIANQVMKLAREQLKNEDITGFQGAEVANKLNIIDNYVLGINPNCK